MLSNGKYIQIVIEQNLQIPPDEGIAKHLVMWRNCDRFVVTLCFVEKVGIRSQPDAHLTIVIMKRN